MGRRFLVATLLVLVLVAAGTVLSRWLFDTPAAPSLPPALVEAAPPASAPAPEALTVRAVEGSVEKRVSDVGAWTKLGVGDTLGEQGAIRTGDNSSARLSLSGGTQLELGARSQSSVRELSRAAARLRLDGGRLAAVVRGDSGLALKIETQGSDATAVAKDAEFSVLADGHGQLSVASRNGKVVLSTRQASVEVNSGGRAVARANEAPTTLVPTSLFLKLAMPKAQLQREKVTVIHGTTAPGAIVSVNGMNAVADGRGVFSARVELKEGRNDIVVEAEDAAGGRRSETVPMTVKSSVAGAKGEVRWDSGKN